MQEKSQFEFQLHATRNERAQVDEYARQEFISDNQKLESLMKNLENIDQLGVDTLFDYGQLIKDNDTKIREKEEANERLRLENARLGKEIEKVQARAKTELQHAEKEYERATQEYGEKFREQSDVQSEYIDIIKEQYDKIQDIYKTKNNLLVTNIDKAKQKCKKAEARRSLELGGFYEDLRLLDKKCNFYENYTNKLKMLVEEDAKKMLERLRLENEANAQQDQQEYAEEMDQVPEQHYGDMDDEGQHDEPQQPGYQQYQHEQVAEDDM